MLKMKLFIYIGIPLIITLISVVGTKLYMMSSTIDKLEDQIEDLKNKKLTLEVDLQTERDNITLLKTTIQEQNTEIEKMAIKNQNTVKAFNDFKKKTDKEKYNEEVLDLMSSELWKSQTCEDGLKLNREIAKLKYKDL